MLGMWLPSGMENLRAPKKKLDKQDIWGVSNRQRMGIP